jgi:hypothetical protein
MDKMREVAKKEVRKHEKTMHGKAFKKGGPTSEDRMKYGRNMSRAMSQRSK